jgi:hypothetical protein
MALPQYKLFITNNPKDLESDPVNKGRYRGILSDYPDCEVLLEHIKKVYNTTDKENLQRLRVLDAILFLEPTESKNGDWCKMTIFLSDLDLDAEIRSNVPSRDWQKHSIDLESTDSSNTYKIALSKKLQYAEFLSVTKYPEMRYPSLVIDENGYSWVSYRAG